MPSLIWGWVFSPLGFSAFPRWGFSSCMFERLPITSRQAFYLCPRFYLSYLAGLCVLTIWQCPLLSEAGLSSWAVSGRPWITAEPGGWGSFRASLLQALSTLCLCQFNSPNCCLGAGGGNWVIKSLLLCQSGGSAILAQYWCRRELYTESDWQVQLKPLVSNFRCFILLKQKKPFCTTACVYQGPGDNGPFLSTSAAHQWRSVCPHCRAGSMVSFLRVTLEALLFPFLSFVGGRLSLEVWLLRWWYDGGLRYVVWRR